MEDKLCVTQNKCIINLVEHHIKYEEKKVLKSAEKALGHDEIQNIMKQFEQEKQKIIKSLK